MLDRGVAEIEAVNGLMRGTVLLGSYPSASAAFLPRLMRRFTERYPHVKVHLSELTTVELADALNSGEVHLALRALTPLQQTHGLACRGLWREPLVAVVPEDHPLAQAGPTMNCPDPRNSR